MIQMKKSSNGDDKLNLQYSYGALFFGVPNQGMDVEALAGMVQGSPQQYTMQLLDEQLGSRLRNRQHLDFCNAFDFLDSKIVQFFELRKSPTVVQVMPFNLLLLVELKLSRMRSPNSGCVTAFQDTS